MAPNMITDEEGSHDGASSKSSAEYLTEKSATSEETPLSFEAQLARDENRMVQRSKCLVYFVLFIFATTLASLTYIFLNRQEESDYKSQVSDV